MHEYRKTGADGPVSASPRPTRSQAVQVVQHFTRTVASCRTLPDDALGGDVTAVTAGCLTLAATILNGRDSSVESEIAQLDSAAVHWAREGIPVDAILHALHEGTKIAQHMVTAGDTADPVELGVRTVDLLDLMTTTVTMAYLREYRAVAGQHHNAVQTLTSALLAGQATTGMARECGVTLERSYHLLAVSIAPHPAPSAPGIDARIVARRALRRVQSVLADQYGAQALSLLSTTGGTILIPPTASCPERLPEVVELLAAAAGTALTAVHVDSPAGDIPELSKTLHDMLDIAVRLHRALAAERRTRLYRFEELAVEYQLTRPGAVRETLARKLDPLTERPDLYETLCVYLLNDQSRQRTARRLHIHPNTIDHRLKRIAQCTGLDTTRAEGLWGLRAALIARTFPTRPGEGHRC